MSRVALVHDWLTGLRGGERVLQGICEMYPQADLFTLGELANLVRERKNGNNAYYNVNTHINPTNVCVYRCNFGAPCVGGTKCCASNQTCTGDICQ